MDIDGQQTFLLGALFEFVAFDVALIRLDGGFINSNVLR